MPLDQDGEVVLDPSAYVVGRIFGQVMSEGSVVYRMQLSDGREHHAQLIEAAEPGEIEKFLDEEKKHLGRQAES